MDLVKALRDERTQLLTRLRGIERALEALSPAPKARGVRKKKKTMSASARHKISRAKKAYWAAKKKEKKPG